VDSLPVTGVCEIALEMLDLEAGERFYSGLLGFPVVERWSSRGGAIIGERADLDDLPLSGKLAGPAVVPADCGGASRTGLKP